MTEPELEEAFDLIAQGIDRAGEKQETIFLSKLALLLAHRHADIAALRAAVRDALQDLDPA